MKLICINKNLKSVEYGEDYSEYIEEFKVGKKSTLVNSIPYNSFSKVYDIKDATCVVLNLPTGKKLLSLSNFKISKKQRSLKTLLLILKKYNANGPMHSGLCISIIHMHAHSIIKYSEISRLLSFIENNRPEIGSKHYNKLQKNSGWYWPLFDQDSRQYWLTDEIQKL